MKNLVSKEELLDKYNIPVPRYTSYPPANHFTEEVNNSTYLEVIKASNHESPRDLSFYIHIPFCKHLCFYCGCNSFPMCNPARIADYIAAVKKEIETVTEHLDKDRKIAQIHYGGGSPTAIPVHYLRELNELLLSKFATIESPEIAVECHPGYLDASYWESLTEAGFNRISIGVQDFNTAVLKGVNRRPSLLPMEQIFKHLRQAGVRINLDFIYGLPLQTVESFQETIQQAIALNPDRIVTFSYAHVPWVNKLQLKLEEVGLPTDAVKNQIQQTIHQQLLDAGYEAIGMDHFVRKEDPLYKALSNQTLHRNFQGYCTRETTGQVYAFGVTAISQLTAAYTQNVKDIPSYIEQINKEGLATTKGYVLNKEEQITREVITSLMCNCSLNWNSLSEHLKLSVAEIKQATAYNEATLQSFAADGLIEWDEQQIIIKADALHWVRNVAASLDKLMLNNSKSYSKPI